MTDVAVPDSVGLRLLGALEGCGAVTPTSLVLLDPDLSYERWAALGSLFGKVKNSVCFWIGDWLCFAERGVYGETYAQAASETGLAEQTLMNYSSTCKRVPASRRRENVSFSCHEAVAPLSPNEQRHWLARAANERLGRDELRALIRASRTPEPVEAGRDGASSSPVAREAEWPTAQAVPLGDPVDSVLEAIRAVTSNAEPIDDERVAVLRRDLEILQAFLGDE